MVRWIWRDCGPMEFACLWQVCAPRIWRFTSSVDTPQSCFSKALNSAAAVQIQRGSRGQAAPNCCRSRGRRGAKGATRVGGADARGTGVAGGVDAADADSAGSLGPSL